MFDRIAQLTKVKAEISMKYTRESTVLVECMKIEDKNIDSNITSAFLKGDTLEHILKFFPSEEGHKYDHILKDLKNSLNFGCKI